MEEMADEAGALGALDIAGVVVHQQRRSGGGAETGEAAEIGAFSGLRARNSAETKILAPKMGRSARKDGVDRGQHAAPKAPAAAASASVSGMGVTAT